jgi:hypothetical protein
VLRLSRKLITGRLGGKRVRSPVDTANASVARAEPTLTHARVLRLARRLAHRPRVY